ncbi:acetylcholine receptor subunit beta-type lev-1-like [Mya arenaria]|uniref:acetylcholine receptor subunit beta-type lev-1-like n=1 Tax=Mya arenaria TaxID=6604 RepID=UPI0022E383A3|nr:acetylcholine receptor subunit beta-type lev-1-like [Mya arenaria]
MLLKETTTSQPTTPPSTTKTLIKQSTTNAPITSTTQAPVLQGARRTEFEVAKLLYRRLLKNYDHRVRPIQNQTHPVYVNTKFVPLTLIDFDTYEQRFSMLGYFKIRWTDEQMMWRPRYNRYIDNVRVATAELWTPNVVIHKSFDGHGGVGSPETDILRISWNGFVQWVPDATYSVVCDVDIQYFPFDEQTCTITYYAADETVDTVELDHYLGTDMSEYSENPSWLIVGAFRKRYVKNNNWHIDVEFRLQRRANFATFTLITPLMMLAFLNICVFLVPVNSGEKGSFSVTIFLSYGIFFTVISDTLLQNSLQISFFVLLIVVLLCLSVISVFYTVIQAKLVSAIGSKQCPITCLRKLQRLNVVKVTPIEHYIETGKHDPEDESYTWKDFLEQLDTFLFVSFLISILLIIAIFFSILMRHVATGDNTFDTDPVTTTRTTPITTLLR